MPRNETGEIQSVRKLKPDDKGYVKGERLFEVEMKPARHGRKRMMSVKQIDARLKQVRANKARAVAMWDERIRRLTEIKAALNE